VWFKTAEDLLAIFPDRKPAPTPEPEPQPTQDPNSVDVALEPILQHLIVIFARIDGKWQSYTGPNALSLDALDRGKGYWMYAAQDLALDLPDFTHNLKKGWNTPAWVSPSSPIQTALRGHEDTIPIVLGLDAQKQRWALYLSSAVAPLVELQPGQTYNTFIQVPQGQGSVKLQVGSNEISLGMLGSWVWEAATED